MNLNGGAIYLCGATSLLLTPYSYKLKILRCRGFLMAHFYSPKCGVLYLPVGQGGPVLLRLTGEKDVLIGMALVAAAVTS